MAYEIVETREFYGPRTERRVVTDEMGWPMEFSTRRDALEWIDARDDEVYYLAHNESDRPTYKVRKVRA